MEQKQGLHQKELFSSSPVPSNFPTFILKQLLYLEHTFAVTSVNLPTCRTQKFSIKKKKKPRSLNSPKRQNDLHDIQAFDSFIRALLKCNSRYKIQSFKWLYVVVQLPPLCNFTLFSSPHKETLNSLESVFKPSSSQLYAMTNLLFVSVTLLILDISCKWNHNMWPILSDLFHLV